MKIMAFIKEDYEIAPELKAITERQVTILDQESANGEGWDYYCNGQIVRAAVYKNRISGTIREYLEEFHVQIVVSEHEIMSSCTCGSREGACKHIVAFLYSWINDHQDFLNIGQTVEQLYQMNKEELIGALERMIQNDPRNVQFINPDEYTEEELNVDGLIN